MKRTLMNPELSNRSRQQGAILVVSLILLLVMTILAITVSQMSRMQERMAGNARDSDMSFQAAEAGLRAAENFLSIQTSQPIPCSATKCVVFQQDVLPADLRAQDQISFWNARATDYGTAAIEMTEVTQDPQYVVEEIGFVPDSLTVGKGTPSGRMFYKNTAHGVGGTASALTVVEGTYTRRY
jgi:type IV pilus assembly protein PilX